MATTPAPIRTFLAVLLDSEPLDFGMSGFELSAGDSFRLPAEKSLAWQHCNIFTASGQFNLPFIEFTKFYFSLQLPLQSLYLFSGKSFGIGSAMLLYNSINY